MGKAQNQHADRGRGAKGDETDLVLLGADEAAVVEACCCRTAVPAEIVDASEALMSPLRRKYGVGSGVLRAAAAALARATVGAGGMVRASAGT